ncbi:hypothetical protein pb186bvf_010947 [Paramecium bursaria]
MSDDEFEEYVIEKPKKNYDAFDELVHQEEFTDFQQAQQDNHKIDNQEDEFDDFRSELPQTQILELKQLQQPVIVQEKLEIIQIPQQQSANPILDKYKVLSDQFMTNSLTNNVAEIPQPYHYNNEQIVYSTMQENVFPQNQQTISDDSHEFEEYQQPQEIIQHIQQQPPQTQNIQKQDQFDEDEFDDYESHLPVVSEQIQQTNQQQQTQQQNYKYNHFEEHLGQEEPNILQQTKNQQPSLYQYNDDLNKEYTQSISIKEDKQQNQLSQVKQIQEQPVQQIEVPKQLIEQPPQKGNKYNFFDDLLQDDTKQEEIIPKIEFVQIPIVEQQQLPDIMSVIKSSYQEQNVRKDSQDNKKPKLQLNKVPDPIQQEDEETEEQYDNYDYDMQSIPKMNKQQQRLQFQTPMIQNDKNLFSFDNGSESKINQDVKEQNEDEFVDYQSSQPETIVPQKVVPMREWRQQIQKQVGEDADCLEQLFKELQELELDLYLNQILEYKQLVRDIQHLRIQKQESLEKEEFEILIVIRDTLRAKEPIALQLKQRVLQIANVANSFGQIPLKDHINKYLAYFGQSRSSNPSVSELQPLVVEDDGFIQKLQKELQKSASVLKLIKLRNQQEKIKFEQKYQNFINGLKRIIQMSFRFKIVMKHYKNQEQRYLLV